MRAGAAGVHGRRGRLSGQGGGGEGRGEGTGRRGRTRSDGSFNVLVLSANKALK